MKSANKFYNSPYKGGQGKCGNASKWYMSPGSGKQQGKVGSKRNKFMKDGPNSTMTTGSK